MRFWPLFILPCCIASVAAAADRLPVTGLYGDDSGCAYQTGGDDYDIDDMRMLRADWISAYIMSCEIVDVATAPSGTHLARGICHPEGTTEPLEAQSFIVRPRDDQGLDVFWDDGTLFGNLHPC